MRDKSSSLETQVAVISSTVANIDKKVDDINRKLENDYVTRIEFDAKWEPISKLVYGLILAVFTSLIGVGLLFLTKR